MAAAVEEALNVMRKGTENRRIGETNLNRESSRSHSVFTCIMESSSKGAEDGCTRVKFSRLNLVDLAGELATVSVLLFAIFPSLCLRPWPHSAELKWRHVVHPKN